MKLKIFHARKLDGLEQAINRFLQSEEIGTIHHTQFSANSRAHLHRVKHRKDE